jgi:UDP-N-acetylmuramoyl-L-alanyl-D-glutamate--2,6-diaminopimelate ligase
MTLAELVRELPITPPRGGDPTAALIEVQGVSHDSRRARPGDLFVAWQGERFDGAEFVAEALRQGAVAVLADRDPVTASGSVPWLRAESPRTLLAPLAARLYQHPDRQLRLVGITGTNGKSTTVALVASILEHGGYPCGVLGTLGYRFGNADFGSGRTTPEGDDFYRILRSMRQLGAAAVAAEVASHALVQGRVAGAELEVAIFTNLTQDHLDFHGDMESYFRAKRALFDQLRPDGCAVLNLDDPYGRRLAEELRCSRRTFSQNASSGADVTPRGVRLDLNGIRGELATPRGPLPFTCRLLGRYNLWNVLAAAAAGEALGLDHGAIAEGIAALPPVRGRLEPIVRGQAFPVLVDYAHTPGGLEAVLDAVRELWAGRVVVVFGCGGDKDRTKRAPMGAAAAKSDLAIVTDDNPRSEDPASIRGAVVAALEQAGASYLELAPRQEAIREALALAQREGDWAVVVAGKGHEEVQIIQQDALPFSDHLVVEQVLGELLGSTQDR